MLRFTPSIRVCCLLVWALAAGVGCSSSEFEESREDRDTSLFNASAMRIHPIFSQLRDWTGDGKSDGIEAQVEFQDPFGDPTKAGGSLLFELFEYRTANPDPRGKRLSNPWIGSIATVDEQRSRWNRTSRTYSFQLAYPEINPKQTYVLTASFRSTSGNRLFDQIVLQGRQEPASDNASSGPSRP